MAQGRSRGRSVFTTLLFAAFLGLGAFENHILSVLNNQGLDDARETIDRAVQIFGGLGVTKGVKVEELYREIRALRIYEGATEVQKLVIARETLKQHSAKSALAAE